MAGSRAQTPAIRTFQMDGNAVGNLSSAVNLFRGDVNLTQTLLSLPGRTRKSKLSVDIAIQYQSNVAREADLWNRDAPTGVLGLGWGFPISYIEAVDDGSPVADTRQYTYYDNGSANTLCRQSQRPLLFRLPASLADTLTDGAVVPTDILTAFRGRGLALAADTLVHGSDGTSWTLEDATNQQSYVLTNGTDGLEAHDGGEIYQLQNYQFRKILYYPTYERWVVVAEDATRSSFGGRATPTDQGFQTALGNGIAWQVWWTGADSAPIWRGASTVTTDQVQVASAWYLVETADRFGNRVSYAYNGWDRDDDGLLPNGTEQRVGVGGLPYTKAVYLTRVTDVFGRTVDFDYDRKLWSDATPEAAREYADPHSAVPSDTPGAYQDVYETLYMSGIRVGDADGSALFAYEFLYAPRPELDDPERAVASVAIDSGVSSGDTCKRFLTGIVMVDRFGAPQVGLNFEYFLDSDGVSSAPGALKAITYPEGGRAEYGYTLKSLNVCQRGLTVETPAAVTGQAVPRVFYGPDYVVVLYSAELPSALSLQIFTWVGSWLCWRPTDDAVLDTGGVDKDTLSVLADADFMVLSFNRADSSNKEVYVFEKNIAQPGQWQAATIDGTTTGRNQPTLAYQASVNDPVSVIGGSTFFLVASMDSYSRKGFYDVLTFRWPTRSWTRESSAASIPYTWFTASGAYYATLDRDGVFTLNHLDGELQWRVSAPVTPSGLASLAHSSSFHVGDIAMTPGAGLVAIACKSPSSTNHKPIYTLWIASWDSAYRVTQAYTAKFTDYLGDDADPAANFVPVVVNDGMVAVNGNILRFSGTQWAVNSTLTPSSTFDHAGKSVRYAYGPDYALQIIVAPKGGVQAVGKVLCYDPATGTWKKADFDHTLQHQDGAIANWPSSGGDDWAVMGQYVFFRGTSSDWTAVMDGPPTADLSALVNVGAPSSTSYTYESESLVDAAPSFLSCVAKYNKTTDEVKTILLRNGGVQGAPVSFDTQSMTMSKAPGVSPQGPQMFVTYPTNDDSFDDASRITLNQYAGDDVKGAIEHHVVTRVVIDDGFHDPIPTAYAFDDDSAGCDASGEVIKFFTARSYPGTDDPADPRYGWNESTYLNGIADLSGANYYDMLDGLQVRTATYDGDGAVLSEKTSTYRVFETVSSSAYAPDAVAVPLRGGWVGQTTQVSTTDGVTTTRSSEFEAEGQPGPFCPKPVRRGFGGDGPRSFTLDLTYGGEIAGCDGLRAINALTDHAQVVRGVESDGAWTPIASTAKTYGSWPSALGEGVETWAGAATYSLLDTDDTAFPFADVTEDEVPAGWVLRQRTTARTLHGQERESVDSLGIPTACLYGADDGFLVARIVNASSDGFAYLGFQSYEDIGEAGGWSLSGVTYDGDDARTGSRSAVLPAGAGASVGITVIPVAHEPVYIVGCWYKTAAGYENDGASGWTVEISGADPIFTPFADTGGRWAYRTIPVTLSGDGDGSARTLTLSVANTADGDVRLNTLMVVPLVNGLTARVYEPSADLITATMDAGGRTSFTRYDDWGQPIATVGVSGQVQEIVRNFLSRQGASDASFDPASPNAQVTLHAADGGIMETFRDGGDWRIRWAASDLAASWSVSDGALVHTAPTADTLTWIGEAPVAPYAVYFEALNKADADPMALSLAVGDVTIRFEGGAYSASQNGGTAWAALGHPPTFDGHWLLVVGKGVVLFFAGGQLLFSEKTSPAGDGPDGDAIVITAASAGTAFRHLTVARDVRLGVVYSDATGRPRQGQQLHEAGALVNAQIFDPLNRSVAVTRNAPGDVGSGADLPVLRYSPGFVDVQAFLDSIAQPDSDWRMSGDVTLYYDGAHGTTDDEGYPYTGTRYEASPRKVKVESGLPGKPYAIDLSIPPERRRTTQYTQGDAEDGSLYRTDVVGPLKTRSVQYTNGRKLVVGNEFYDASGERQSQAKASRDYGVDDGAPESTLVNTLPNALGEGPQTNDAAYSENTVKNALSRVVESTDPDTGTTAFVYDTAGQLRFMRPAMGPDEAWYVYYRYDALGRMTEQGTVNQAWDAAAVQALAEDASAPDASIAVVATIWFYDGDGTDPRLIGNKTGSVSHNPAPEGSTPESGDDAQACTVTEDFGYDDAGQMISVGTSVPSFGLDRAEVRYRYNALGEIVQLTYPVGSPLGDVFYGRDDQGRVVAVGTSRGGAEVAACTYPPDGSMSGQSLGGGQWNQAFTYDSPGWATALTTTSANGDQSFTLTYTYAADSTVETMTADYAFTGQTAEVELGVSYDGQRRIAATSGTYPMRIDRYDPNGNIWAAAVGDSETTYTCAPGSDRLASVDADGTASDMVYNARGQLISGLGRGFTYDRVTNLTTSVETSSGTTRFAYGGTRQRVAKWNAGSGEGVVYVFGAGTSPVALLGGDGSRRCLVHGPLGLTALVGEDRTLYPIKDPTRSVWAVVDSDGLVASRAYLPFGQTAAATGDAAACPYLFQGQEWDAETGLYNMKARLYDPALMRFPTPDPAGQFASPYVFAANNPLVVTDPTGEISQGASAGTIAMITALGIALTAFTGGASDAAAAAADAALTAATAGAEVAAETAAEAGIEGAVAAGTEAATEAGAEVAGEAVTEAAGEAATEGAAEGAGEVSAGASAAQAEAEGNTFSKAMKGVMKDTLISAAKSGAGYVKNCDGQFNAKEFFKTMGISAAATFASAGVGAGMESLLGEGGGVAKKIARGALIGAVTGVVEEDVSQLLTNVAEHEPWYQGLATTTKSAARGGARSGVQDLGKERLKEMAKQMSASVITDRNKNKTETAMDKIQDSAAGNGGDLGQTNAQFATVKGLSA